MSTGNLRPGIRKTGASSKKVEKRAVSSVAEATKTFSSGRKRATSLINPKRMSVCRVRSCASSTITTLGKEQGNSEPGSWPGEDNRIPWTRAQREAKSPKVNVGGGGSKEKPITPVKEDQQKVKKDQDPTVCSFSQPEKTTAAKIWRLEAKARTSQTSSLGQNYRLQSTEVRVSVLRGKKVRAGPLRIGLGSPGWLGMNHDLNGPGAVGHPCWPYRLLLGRGTR